MQAKHVTCYCFSCGTPRNIGTPVSTRRQGRTALLSCRRTGGRSCTMETASHCYQRIWCSGWRIARGGGRRRIGGYRAGGSYFRLVRPYWYGLRRSPAHTACPRAKRGNFFPLSFLRGVRNCSHGVIANQYWKCSR